MKNELKFPHILFSLVFFLLLIPTISAYSSYDKNPNKPVPPTQVSPVKEPPYLFSTEPVDSFVDKHFKNIPVLTEDLRFFIGGESRYRMEYRYDYDFNRGRDDSDAFSLFRNRVNGELKFQNWISLFAEMQDAQVVGSQTQNQGNAFQNLIDLRQCFVELRWPEGKSFNLTGINLINHIIEHSLFKAGRQELFYGDQRFIGVFDFSNVTQTFDALKYRYDTKARSLDFFWARIVKIQDGESDSTANGNHLLGVYWTEKWIPNHVLDTFMFVRQNDSIRFFSELPPVPGGTRESGSLTEFTLGNRLKGNWKQLDYETEYGLQFGRRGGDDLLAFAFHQTVGYTFPIVFKPRPFVSYNFGSGDENPTDGHFNIFDNLFPSNHDRYGLIDFASLQNISHVKIGCNIEPAPRLKVTPSFHFFYLDDNQSPWFSAARTVIRNGQAGASKTLGKEFDLVAWWQMAKHVRSSIGFAYWFSGPFVKDTGTHNNAAFFYAQTQVNF